MQLKYIFIPLSVKQALDAYDYKLGMGMSVDSLLGILGSDDRYLVETKTRLLSKVKSFQKFGLIPATERGYDSVEQRGDAELCATVFSGCMSNSPGKPIRNAADATYPVALSDGTVALCEREFTDTTYTFGWDVLNAASACSTLDDLLSTDTFAQQIS